MRDVIQKIVATENEAKCVVDAAKVEAERTISDAQKKGRDIIERSRQEALAEAGRIVEAAVEEAEREKQRRLADAADGMENQIRLDTATREWAVEEVIRCVCKRS